MVDGKPAKDVKTHVDPDTQEVTVYGEPIDYREFIYLMMNKPQGVLSATEDSRQQTVVDLLTPEEMRFEPFPAGRLDKDTEGFCRSQTTASLHIDFCRLKACSKNV